jgi:hypothetical protein
MRPLFLLLILMFVFPGQNRATSQEESSVKVLGSKWYKTRQAVENVENANVAPVRSVIQANKNFERNVRINAPVGARDPNDDTIDGRSAAIEKNVQASRTPQSKPIDGFAYRVKVQNASEKVIEILFWEYQFVDPSDPATMARRQFLCGVNIKPEKEKEIQAFSLSGPSDVISVGNLANKSGNAFQEKVVINRVEYADGSIWQRKDWNFGEIRLTYQRAIGTPWGAEMCRSL